MAHQAHNIPWETLASNFKFTVANGSYGGETNLFPLFRERQNKELIYFTKAFIRTLEDYSTHERNKYPATYITPNSTDIVISTATAKRIKNTVLEYRSTAAGYSDICLGCRQALPDTLSLEHRNMAYWLEALRHSPQCGPGWMGGGMAWHPKDPVEMTKTLLLYNEMETLFLLASAPGSRAAFSEWWSSWFWISEWSHSSDRGWSELMRCALMSYICLNVLYLKPETHSCPDQEEEKPDYRWTSSYQKVLVRCTRDQIFDTQTYPHREFFGIVRGQIASCSWQTDPLYGHGPPSRLYYQENSEKDPRKPLEYIRYYSPTAEDVSVVDEYLQQKRLPTELILDISYYADYRVKRRTPIPDDPLHPENNQELRKYLNYCWKLLMRCDLLAKEGGCCIDWEAEITNCIWELWGEQAAKMLEKDPMMDRAEERWRERWEGREDSMPKRLRTRRGYAFLV